MTEAFQHMTFFYKEKKNSNLPLKWGMGANSLTYNYIQSNIYIIIIIYNKYFTIISIFSLIDFHVIFYNHILAIAITIAAIIISIHLYKIASR